MTILLGSKLASRVRKGANTLYCITFSCLDNATCFLGHDGTSFGWMRSLSTQDYTPPMVYNELDGVYSTEWDGKVINPYLVQGYLTKGGGRVLSDLHLNLLFLALYTKYKE
jgi:hypothetical protein